MDPRATLRNTTLDRKGVKGHMTQIPSINSTAMLLAWWWIMCHLCCCESQHCLIFQTMHRAKLTHQQNLNPTRLSGVAPLCYITGGQAGRGWVGGPADPLK